jgi:hypothetical protein
LHTYLHIFVISEIYLKCHVYSKGFIYEYLFLSSSSSTYHKCRHCWGTCLPYGSHIRKTDYNPPHEPSATANTANQWDQRLKFLPKRELAWDNKFLVTHPMTDQSCLISAIARRPHWPRGHLARRQSFSLRLT